MQKEREDIIAKKKIWEPCMGDSARSKNVPSNVSPILITFNTAFTTTTNTGRILS